MVKENIEEYIGREYHNLTIISDAGIKNGRQCVIAKCNCKDKTIKEYKLKHLKNGDTKSCGCLKREKAVSRAEKHIGKQYGRWIVVSFSDIRNEKLYVNCICGCPDRTKKEVMLRYLLNGESTSCGCYKRELTGQRFSKHNLCDHKLYDIWASIIQRCYNKKNKAYKNYGGRGIIVCKEWKHSPKLFIDWCINNGWREGLEIDRENNDGNYEQDNCRFITRHKNILNQRVLRETNTSGYRGVKYRMDNDTWRAKAVYKYETVFDKSGFATAKSAAIARDIFCIKNNIPIPLNFPELAINGPL